jgi:hypothetical protein
MKKWQRITGLLAAGAGLLVLAVWLSSVSDAASQSVPESSSATNAIPPGAKARSATNAALARTRPGVRPGGPATNAAFNAARGRLRAGQATNPFPSTPRPGPGAGLRPTNAPAAKALGPGPRGGGKTAAAPQAAPAATAKTGSRIVQTFRQWRASPSFVPVLSASLFGLFLGVLLLVRLIKSRKEAAAVPAGPPSSMASRMARRRTSAAAVHSCNVLEVGAQGRHLWHFNARSGSFVLNREQAVAAGEALSPGLIARDWRSLFQRKLNIAWLPPEQVFLRVAQFPLSDYTETVAMVELQLEKLSPMPVTQIVWSVYVLPQVHDNQQTVIVMVAARNGVEEFLGQLEGQGFLADRLEMPALDQLQATTITSEGVWIYANAGGAKNTGLAAWWYGGVLRNLDLITLPAINRSEGLKEQLMQIAWAGEMEGWLTSTPSWHLVADAAAVAEWEPALRAGLEQPVEISAPLQALQMAALTATRATQAEAQANLLPVEFATRYQQQFVDRLWMGGLGAVVGLYIIGVAIYLVALEVALIRTRSVEQSVAEVAPAYTNAIEVKARCDVLRERQELKYAALDCWQALAELLPASITLEGYNFSEGKHLSLSGTAPADQQQELLQFDGAMRKYMKDGQPLFDAKTSEGMTMRGVGANSQTLNWNTTFELKRVEAQ